MRFPILADYFHKAIVKKLFSAVFSLSHDFRHIKLAAGPFPHSPANLILRNSVAIQFP
jgi:hypothetical protein